MDGFDKSRCEEKVSTMEKNIAESYQNKTGTKKSIGNSRQNFII